MFVIDGDRFVTSLHMVPVTHEMRELLVLLISNNECYSLINLPSPKTVKVFLVLVDFVFAFLSCLAEDNVIFKTSWRAEF